MENCYSSSIEIQRSSAMHQSIGLKHLLTDDRIRLAETMMILSDKQLYEHEANQHSATWHECSSIDTEE